MKTTKNFIFLFVMVLGVKSFEAGKVKRSLVSRFTSNPFFLRHFAGSSAYYHNYESYHSKPKSDEYIWKNEENREPRERKQKKNRILRKQVLVSTQFNSAQNEEHSHSTQAAEVYIFNSLPHFENPIIFREKGKQVAQHSDLVIKNPHSENIKEGSVQAPSVNQVNRKDHIEINTAEPILIKDNQKLAGAEIYIFNSLPHYHRSVTFVGKTRKPAEHHPELIIENVQEKNNSQRFFNILPFYEITHVFENQNAKSQVPVTEQVFVFKSSPHDLVRTVFKEITEKPEFIKKEDNFGGIEYDFSSLPHFEIQQRFFEPQLFISKLDNKGEGKHQGDLRTLPSSVDQPHKRIVKVVKKKKLHNKLVDVAESKLVVENIADLPLETSGSYFENKFNSYGGFVSLE